VRRERKGKRDVFCVFWYVLSIIIIIIIIIITYLFYFIFFPNKCNGAFQINNASEDKNLKPTSINASRYKILH